MRSPGELKRARNWRGLERGVTLRLQANHVLIEVKINTFLSSGVFREWMQNPFQSCMCGSGKNEEGSPRLLRLVMLFFPYI